ncbi:Aste57867_16555 [Aphanomyces stellatus]|uniref:Aste57867_16555 protein n=1 Tax=Aphanomyces stellatus TaxID=120398 RepID=A0A485L6Y4_9STRA|nr:hypothetical protein As57867_016498 [Aphanomyces stellatus]VFT93329.1 Aste57867_16555 [Aphanomyces stellatus]
MAERSSAYAYVLRRSLGETHASEYIEDVYADGSRKLALNQKKVIHKQGMNVWHMDLDAVEHQYLLVGAGTGAMYIFDMSVFDTLPLPVDSSSIKPMAAVKPLKRPRDASHFNARMTQDLCGHAGGVSAVQWYPVDNGMFISASHDTTVKLWDANEMEVASSFCVQDMVHAASFSPSSSLVAVGTDRPEVRLCDIAIGASTHQLLGHRAAVRCLSWSKTDEFHVASGAADGSIRLWDIRRSGATACLMVLNQDGPADLPRRETPAHHRPASLSSSTRLPPRKKQKAQDNDPHVAASVSRATAHTQAIQSLRYTPDGRFLVSSGADGSMRLWNAATGENMFHNYGKVKCQGARPITVGLAQESSSASTMIYHPSGSNGTIVSYLLHGENHSTPCTKYTGHYSRVTTCIYRPTTRELISGGEDGLIMLWSPPPVRVDPVEESSGGDEGKEGDEGDTWSDDENATPGDVFEPPILR